MRNSRLLLYAGAMACALAGPAFAYELAPSNGSTPGAPPQVPSGTGTTTNTSGFMQIGTPYTQAEGQQYTPGTASPGAAPFSTPAPGTAIMRINMQLVTAYVGAFWTGMNGQGFGAAATAGQKENWDNINAWIRLDFATDGMTAGGMRYGGFFEIREESVGNLPASASTTAPAAQAAAVASSTGSGTSADNYQNVLFVRNVCGYVGSDAIGILKMGQGSCVDTGSAMLTGLNDDIDYGGWDGAAGPFLIAPAWPWPDSGADYMPQGIAYYSPVLAGFDGAISFNPSEDTAQVNGATCASNTGCPSQSASSAAGDIARWTNRLELGLRYRNAVGPVGFAISGTYAHSGTVTPSQNAATTGDTAIRYNPLNFAIIGAEISFNKYFAIGANTMFGAFNGAGTLQAKPIGAQTSATTAIAWEAGAKFTVPSLPITAGASYYNFKYQGQPGLPTQRVSQGIDVGADYGFGPGMVAFAEYLWGQESQGGYNFLTAANSFTTGCTGANLCGANNVVSVQVGMIGLALQF